MRSSVWATILSVWATNIAPPAALAQNPTDTIAKRDMKTVVVSGQATATSVSVRRDGAVSWNTEMFGELPKILGNADPVHYTQMLPGIQTNSEMDAGLHIQGSDQTHNRLSIQDVPVYNAAHVLGLFSVFNASHYSAMTLRKGAQEAGDPLRLGGMLDMELPGETQDSVGGEVAVGIVSSQGTVRIPTGRNATLTLSGRGSYVNLLYGRWLREDNMQMYYSFYDANATWLWRPRRGHRVWLDFYAGDDRIRMHENEYMARMHIAWGNRVAAVHWRADWPSIALHSTAYVTSYHNRMRLSQADATFHLPSDITDLGWRSRLAWRGVKAGLDASWYDILPQDPQAEGVYSTQLSRQPRYHTQEYSAFAGYDYPLLAPLTLNAGVRGTVYIDFEDEAHFSADPSVSLRLTRPVWSLDATYSVRHQYLFQTGTSSLGMPTEFWTSTGGASRPQWGHGVSLAANVYLADGRYRLSADAYLRRLYHQVEYDGDIMKFLNTDYRLEDNLLYGRGRNYGFSVMAHKRSGALTGWVGYTYGRARRRFDESGLNGTFPANHERPHEVNLLLTWHLSHRWTLSGVYTFASGTPFTAPEHFYVMNGMLLADYGPHNAYRLRPYRRADLSVNLFFHPRRVKEHGINLSVCNVTGHGNDITCRLKIHNNRFHYSHYALLKFPLPSVSYFVKF